MWRTPRGSPYLCAYIELSICTCHCLRPKLQCAQDDLLRERSLKWRRVLSPRSGSPRNSAMQEDWIMRGLTLHQLKDIISDVYGSKAKSDARCALKSACSIAPLESPALMFSPGQCNNCYGCQAREVVLTSCEAEISLTSLACHESSFIAKPACQSAALACVQSAFEP